jgi:hypothetical protein
MTWTLLQDSVAWVKSSGDMIWLGTFWSSVGRRPIFETPSRDKNMMKSTISQN